MFRLAMCLATAKSGMGVGTRWPVRELDTCGLLRRAGRWSAGRQSDEGGVYPDITTVLCPQNGRFYYRL